MAQTVDNATNRDKGKEAKQFSADKGKSTYTKLTQ